MPKIIPSGKTKHHGSNEEKENREQYTPSYNTCELKCPEFLSEAEKAEWEVFTAMIKEIKGHAVTDADIHIIIMAVKCWCNYLKYDKSISIKPDQYLLLPKPNKDGDTVYAHVKNPDYYQRKVELQNHIDCLTKLGIDPVGRAKVGLARLSYDKSEQDSAFMGLLNRKGDND